jgi:hypothetical protein
VQNTVELGQGSQLNLFTAKQGASAQILPNKHYEARTDVLTLPLEVPFKAIVSTVGSL